MLPRTVFPHKLPVHLPRHPIAAWPCLRLLNTRPGLAPDTGPQRVRGRAHRAALSVGLKQDSAVSSAGSFRYGDLSCVSSLPSLPALQRRRMEKGTYKLAPHLWNYLALGREAPPRDQSDSSH